VLTGTITYKKGWLRCKHGILLKRGKKVVGHCSECSTTFGPVNPNEQVFKDPLMRDLHTYLTLFQSSDKGVT
jgi:hypothetical protein